MALIKCKECGKEISKKAKSCPHCGAQTPKPTSAVTWLVLILIIGAVFSSIMDDTPAPPANKAAPPAKAAKPTPTPKPAWRHWGDTDEMTGKTQQFVMSPKAPPLKKMEFPYHDVTAFMGAGCQDGKEWAYFGFSTAPNLNDDETKKGYSLITTRIKWDDRIETVKLTQEWGDKFISFQNDAAAISNAMQHNKVLLELNWHGSGNVHFEIPLHGSTAAIKGMRTACK